MVRDQRMSRARFLAGAGAAGIAAAGLLPTAGTAAAAPETRAEENKQRGLTYRGVCYEVGDGETPGTAWSTARMRQDMLAIRNDLHASSVLIGGVGVDRLTSTATEAVERGLHVWLQPTLGDRSEADILEHVAEAGRHADRLRRQGARIHLSAGCEFVLFVPGIVPGDNAVERIENLLSGNVDPEFMARRLRAFTARAAAVGRSVFRGRLTYAAAQDEQVDWNLFDIVGIDYYSSHPRRADHVREISRYLRWGKPLAMLEFGSCTFLGAPEQGGMGWNTVDHSKDPPEIRGDLVRSERTQAAHLTDVLDVFESMNLYAAMAYTFVTPDAPHRPEPRYDLDMASYSIVKAIRDRADDPASGWHWEPKESFHALARQYCRMR
ncbi:abortive phage infection protein [Streptomyces sp. NBC_00306]|uniref:abortive phage infection protein n=1 Tax=Streptomyces sp. NBC_00306 TaxID=2975708 RepID=UPI002E2E573F|nr:abortive phage infection protein [Streptomyces sp. NBC_00306]